MSKEFEQVISKEKMYRSLHISRQGYYQWLNKDISELELLEELMIKEILEIRVYQPFIGQKKLYKQVKRSLGEQMYGRDKFIKFLKEKNMVVNQPPKTNFNYANASSGRYASYALEDIEIRAVGQVIASDITYLPRHDKGFYYLHLCVDLQTRVIVGWNLSRTLETKHSIRALKRGISMLKAHKCFEEGWIHHSDRGCQYASADYAKVVESNKGYQSMTIGGAPYQNAIVERINGILKQEFIPRTVPSNFRKVEQMIRKSIDTYNNKRLHWSLNLETPMSELTNIKTVNVI